MNKTSVLFPVMKYPSPWEQFLLRYLDTQMLQK